jgi:hypothetical protein
MLRFVGVGALARILRDIGVGIVGILRGSVGSCGIFP